MNLPEPTEEGRKLAADLAKAERNEPAFWQASWFEHGSPYVALDRLATQKLADDAKLAELMRDMAKLHGLAESLNPQFSNSTEGQILAIAAKHRAVDPLVEAFLALPPEFAGCIDAADRFRAELAKRGLSIVETKQ